MINILDEEVVSVSLSLMYSRHVQGNPSVPSMTFVKLFVRFVGGNVLIFILTEGAA